MKKSKTTIALLLAALMLLGTAGMAFASEESASCGASGTELPLERGYSWYTCTAPEYLNIRAERSTADAGNTEALSARTCIFRPAIWATDGLWLISAEITAMCRPSIWLRAGEEKGPRKGPL